jgi:transcriptional regulator with XRE-family HTH domain
MGGIGDRVRRLRVRAGLTQQALAVAAGLSVSAVAQIEAGKTPDPRLSTLRAMAGALGVSIDEFASDGKEAAPPVPRQRKKGRG